MYLGIFGISSSISIRSDHKEEYTFKFDKISRTCRSTRPPLFRNIALRHFYWHFCTYQDIRVSTEKKHIASASGILKHMRTIKSVKNKENANLKLKKHPVYRNDYCMWARNCNAIYTTECLIYSYHSILGFNCLFPACGTHKI